jgi:tetratricopeptide (TPR) repeat protein
MSESNSQANAAALRMEMLKKYLAEDPADDFSEYALALEYEKSGNYKEALFHLEEIIRRNPDYLAAYYQCGRFYESEKEFEKAMAAYQKGMETALKQGNTKTLNELRSALELMD